MRLRRLVNRELDGERKRRARIWAAAAVGFLLLLGLGLLLA